MDQKKRVVHRIEPGQRYGRLTVVAKTDRRVSNRVVWECRCDCGNTTYVTSNHLANGNTKSCGCARTGTNLLDLSGQRFGRSRCCAGRTATWATASSGSASATVETQLMLHPQI